MVYNVNNQYYILARVQAVFCLNLQSWKQLRNMEKYRLCIWIAKDAPLTKNQKTTKKKPTPTWHQAVICPLDFKKRQDY